MQPVPAARVPQGETARVMICDDSAVIRTAIARILEADPAITVAVRVGNGQAALNALKLHDIDVVVLDVEMPVMDGLTALPLLLQADPGLRIVMASTLTTRGADIAMRALRLGAADYVPKPTAGEISTGHGFAPELIAKVKGLARQRGRAQARLSVDLPLLPTLAPTRGLALRPPPRQAPILVAIGSSTGGPNALFTLVHGLSQRLPVPVVITQHMPPSFIPILADHIAKCGELPCTQAQDGAQLIPGRILIAPGDRHLLIRSDAKGLFASLSDAPPENFCRPAVDPMLRSACAATDGQVLAVILTGMGQDGMAGTKAIIDHGGAALAQDEATSVVWGMPGAVARAGLAHAVLPISQIAPKIHSLLGVR